MISIEKDHEMWMQVPLQREELLSLAQRSLNMGVYFSLKSLSYPCSGLENPYLSQVVENIYVLSQKLIFGQYLLFLKKLKEIFFLLKAQLSPVVDTNNDEYTTHPCPQQGEDLSLSFSSPGTHKLPCIVRSS